MKWMGLNEIREAHLSFFESKGHMRLPSFSLVPKDDNSLLIVNSGMAPMKKYFTGEVAPPAKRVTTCQKCVRNTDIENVGITPRHCTYFEMLGNFSFGDYFKKEAIPWAWEFYTKVLEIPEELLHISVYEEDDEAYDIWVNDIGIKKDHMVRLGKEDNFWEHGAGPCGPSSELYFDRGEETGCGNPDCKPGCECDRFVELGNIVFTQFESDGNGTYTPLENPNIDYGGGIERLACVMQGVSNVFLIDTMQEIMKHISKIAGIEYGKNEMNDISLRIITDHIRSIVFMIGDGILPANDGRGYVLRRLLRRASRHGKLLKINKVFLTEVADTVIDVNKDAYPELDEKRDTIKTIISHEEEGFAKTIDQGMEILSDFIEKMDSKVFSGEQAFLLNDTYGFPIDLTKEILAEKKLSVDEKKFLELMREQRERARNARKDAGEDAWLGEGNAAEGLPETIFTGYDELETESKILAIIRDGELIDTADEGEEVAIVLNRTPFYAEGGGQVGDTGVIKTDTAEVEVKNTTKTHADVYIHRAVIKSGIIKTDDNVDALVDRKRREEIMRNHTAAHLLQAALREVLGTHVEQAGQLVDDERVRFDFTHFSGMTPEEIAQVEKRVNDIILEAIPVRVQVMSAAEARESGAMALFGEKYGDTVRVVSVNGFSKELCGGTHASSTANLGLFKIQSESSVASGVRRIEGATGYGVLKMMQNFASLITETAKQFRMTNQMELASRASQFIEEMHEKDRIIEKLNAQIASSKIDNLFESAVDVNGIKLIAAFFSNTPVDSIKNMADEVKGKDEAAVALIAGGVDGKISIVAAVNEAAQKCGIKAGQLVKEVAMITGGNGGGRPDFAMAGAKDITKIDEAIEALPEIIKKYRA